MFVIPIGSLVNAFAIILGGCLGLLLGNRLSESMRKIVFQGLGLCVMIIGIQMALQSKLPLVMIFSILLGCIAGELLRLENWFNRGGNLLKRLFRSKNAAFTEGFVSATLLFCIGAMAILGALEEGLQHGRTTLLSKAILDGFASVAMASALGSGVLLAAVPVLLYQGLMTVFAVYLQSALSPDMQRELIAVGGIMIVGIGLNLLEVAKISLSNMLPALFCVVLIMLSLPFLQGLLPV